jgi:predicted esterase
VAPVEQNQPYLASALGVIAGLVERISGDGLPREKIVIAGFSQGACLALEFAARNPQRYGGVVGLSGGLIGETINLASYAGSLSGTPAFIGCSNIDPHIPLSRVEETADIFGSLGARVTIRIYPGMGHTINEDEMTSLRGIVSDAIGQEF